MNPRLPRYDDPGRLTALHRMEIIDTPAEPEFDELVELAAAVCEVPISLLSFIDEKRQWYKAAIGIEETEKPLELTFCQYTICQDDLLLVEDTRLDAGFVTHPAVVCEPGLRFYAGLSLKTPDGFAIGTLCVADYVPRRLTATQITTLKVLGRHANARIELRDHRHNLQNALTEARQATERLAASEARFKMFMDNAPFFGFLKDPDGSFVFLNQRIADNFGVSGEDWLGKTDFDLFPEELASTYRVNDLAVMEGGKLRVLEEQTLNRDGSTSFWRSYKFPCPGPRGTLLGGISFDITEDVRLNAELLQSQAALEDANTKLRELASTDALTGVPNRRAFDERLGIEFAVARRSLRPLSVLLFDIDDFKRHNDRYGHDAGDQSLRQFAALLRQAARSHDLIARYGGEEFAVLLPGANEEQASEMGERMLRLLRSTAWPIEAITASAGVASLTPSTPSPSHLVTLADEALYVAKRSGKDRVVTYGNYSKEIGVHVELPPYSKPR